MSRRWKQPAANSKALPCQFLADEARAALPSATQRRPRSARARTARTARRSRRKERREEVQAFQHYLPPHSHTAQERDVQWVDGQNSAASILNASGNDNKSVHSCDTSWVSHKCLNIPPTLLCRKFLPPPRSYCPWRMDLRETTSSDSRHGRPQRKPRDLPR